MKYVFTSKRGRCTQYTAFGKVYFIQDICIGGDKYIFALMSRTLENKIPQKFPDTKKMISELIGKEIKDDIAVNLLLSHITIYQLGARHIIEQDGVMYLWDELKKELREYTEPKQETGYFDSYLDCLNMAKEILKIWNNRSTNGKEILENGVLYCDKSGKIILPMFTVNEENKICNIKKCRNRCDEE